MCTVSYIPIQHPKGFILTSNRDEAPLRAATKIVVNNEAGIEWMFPQDPKGKGSWIAANNKGRCVCLLNGAFEPHTPDPPYRKSRGLVLLDALKANDPKVFFETYELLGIEAFTLVFISDDHLYELRWDGNLKHLKALETTKSHIWASSTLYSKEIIQERKHWFAEWQIKHPNPAQDQILDFHTYSGKGDKKNDLIMNREDRVRTVSISSVWRDDSQISLKHRDLLSSKTEDYSLALISSKT